MLPAHGAPVPGASRLVGVAFERALEVGAANGPRVRSGRQAEQGEGARPRLPGELGGRAHRRGDSGGGHPAVHQDIILWCQFFWRQNLVGYQDIYASDFKLEPESRLSDIRCLCCIMLQVWRVRRRAAVRDERDAAEAGQCVSRVSSIVVC
jgi:hypothetical protein